MSIAFTLLSKLSGTQVILFTKIQTGFQYNFTSLFDKLSTAPAVGEINLFSLFFSIKEII
jgi:hypothetical protein